MSGLPWESAAPLPWEAGSIYPRIIAITRPTQPVTAGANGYSGVQIADETVILAGIACNIQIDRTGRASPTKLPADPIGEPTHKIFVPAGVLAAGTVLERDIATDDTGKRYQVIAIEWQLLGVQLRAQVLEN